MFVPDAFNSMAAKTIFQKRWTLQRFHCGNLERGMLLLEIVTGSNRAGRTGR